VRVEDKSSEALVEDLAVAMNLGIGSWQTTVLLLPFLTRQQRADTERKGRAKRGAAEIGERLTIPPLETPAHVVGRRPLGDCVDRYPGICFRLLEVRISKKR
jgi:hypothetical protein